MFLARPSLALLGLLALAGFSSSDANAQQIYRIVGPDGRITFSDKAPLEANARATPGTGASASVAAVASGSLPFELRQIAARYPVTLYTAPGCAPCASGRTMLSARGVPFAEKTVTSNEDIEALKRLAGTPALPFLTIGAQQLKGYSEIEWVQFLDAAGYPRISVLSASYVGPPATPLVAVEDPTSAVRSAQKTPRAAPAPAPRPAPATAENPAGIIF